MANTFNLGNGSWAQKTEKLLAYNAENDNYKPLPFDFDRGSTATRVNKQGLIETVGVDEPRIDFLNNTKGHLLLEPSRTNYVVYSETEGIIYGSNGWASTPSNIVVTQNYGTTPFSGTELKSTRVQYTGSGQRLENEFTAVTIQAAATMYVKGTSGETIKFGTSSNESIFTLTGDWQKIEQIDSTSRSSSKLTINTYSGATARDIEIYAPQVEQGSYPTSYIPTSGSAVTRSAETCNNAGNSTVFNDSEGVLYGELKVLHSSNVFDFGLYANTSTKLLRIGFFNNDVYASLYNGSYQTQMSAPNDLSDFTKIAFKFKENDFALWINGNEVATDTSGTTFNSGDLEKLNLSGQNGTSSLVLGKVKDLRVYNTALTDAELQALTS